MGFLQRHGNFTSTGWYQKIIKKFYGLQLIYGVRRAGRARLCSLRSFGASLFIRKPSASSSCFGDFGKFPRKTFVPPHPPAPFGFRTYLLFCLVSFAELGVLRSPRLSRSLLASSLRLSACGVSALILVNHATFF